MELLNSVETDVLLYCCTCIVNYVTARLTLKVFYNITKFKIYNLEHLSLKGIFYVQTIPTFLDYYIEMFGWVEVQLQEISKKCKTESYFCSSVIDNINVVKSRYLLRKEFQISITFNETYAEKIRILRTYIEQLCNGKR